MLSNMGASILLQLLRGAGGDHHRRRQLRLEGKEASGEARNGPQ
jgi:hypothetical protein